MSQEELKANTLICNGETPIESNTESIMSVDKKPKDLNCQRLVDLVNELYDQKKQHCMSLKEQRRKLQEYMNMNINMQDSDESQDEEEDEDEVGEDDSDSDSDSDFDSECDDESDSDETDVSSVEDDSDTETNEDEQESSENDNIAVNLKSNPFTPVASSAFRKPIVVVPKDHKIYQSAPSSETASKAKSSKCPAIQNVAPMSCPASSSQSTPRIQRRTTLASGLRRNSVAR
ncbi:uncharacterized protein LOC110186062 [Drosophila serrata]|uniref:uncharacterized protein LOC110186062 n=1 Tax=Drosophila serrata TaxID=7274 RepID=UPI000A1D0EFD|nr:uncharacterized protein LOC110186062 [Drosophila serrata]